MNLKLIHKQRGIAIVMALLLTTLAITIVSSLFWQQQVQVRSIENQRLQLQKQWILIGAIDWASLIVRDDAKYSNIDALDEPWAAPLAEVRLDQYLENGQADAVTADATLSGSIRDAQARYNLGNLSTNGIIDPVEVTAFKRLLINVRLNPALAQATANGIAAAQKDPATLAASDHTQPGSQSMSFTQLEDLLFVPGFTPEILAQLRDFVILLPHATPVNVNTASAEVLSARIEGLALPIAAALVARRSIASFHDLNDFANRLPGKTLSAPPGTVSVMTHYFLVFGKVRMSRAELEMRALIERNGTTTRLIWIRDF
jgi:general secretion pathway protein K